jgi:hypothetical protein
MCCVQNVIHVPLCTPLHSDGVGQDQVLSQCHVLCTQCHVFCVQTVFHHVPVHSTPQVMGQVRTMFCPTVTCSVYTIYSTYLYTPLHGDGAGMDQVLSYCHVLCTHCTPRTCTLHSTVMVQVRTMFCPTVTCCVHNVLHVPVHSTPQ